MSTASEKELAAGKGTEAVAKAVYCNDDIAAVRRFNRCYTNIMGYIDRHVLETEFTLPEGRLLHEIGKASPCTLMDLSGILRMDTGYLSRIIKKFESLGLLYKKRSETDGRVQELYLTEKGRSCVNAVNEASSAQIAKLLEPLSEEERKRLLTSMAEIEKLLSRE